MTSYDDAVAVTDLARAWQAVGSASPIAASPASPVGCAVPGCNSMTFVELKTSQGSASLCFSHFESVKADATA